MNGEPQPAVGQMFLYDLMTPPLEDNSYRMTVSTNVTLDTGPVALPSAQAYFDVVGPRFSLAATEVAGVFPPRNGHGPYEETVPHIALGRRTMPWERLLDPAGRIPPRKARPGDLPPPNGRPPWLALLLFEEGEYTIHQNLPLEQVLPAQVLHDLHDPRGITCDAVESNLLTVLSILPSVEELQLLAHVRQVNVDDRELSAGSSGGWFAVVMSNRLPSPGAKCRACLVSLEGRSDLVSADPPPVAGPGLVEVAPGPRPGQVVGPALAGQAAAGAGRAGRAGIEAPAGAGAELAAGAAAGVELAAGAAIGAAGASAGIGAVAAGAGGDVSAAAGAHAFRLTVRLVLLHSWAFETLPTGNFRDLMQSLDVSMFGTVAEPGHPALTDTGHLRLQLQDRAGEQETAWYRGPLVPFQLTRDPLGPYHSADQCRRATPETGAEDVSYAAAFEAGRLLAAADPRLAQELMRWRREAYRQASRADTVRAAARALPPVEALDLHRPVAGVMAASAAERVAAGAGALADPYGLDQVGTVVGLDPGAVQEAWQLGTPAEAAAVLGGDAGALGAPVAVPARTPRGEVTLDQVAADAAGLGRLGAARDRLLANARQRAGGGR